MNYVRLALGSLIVAVGAGAYGGWLLNDLSRGTRAPVVPQSSASISETQQYVAPAACNGTIENGTSGFINHAALTSDEVDKIAEALVKLDWLSCITAMKAAQSIANGLEILTIEGNNQFNRASYVSILPPYNLPFTLETEALLEDISSKDCKSRRYKQRYNSGKDALEQTGVLKALVQQLEASLSKECPSENAITITIYPVSPGFSIGWDDKPPVNTVTPIIKAERKGTDWTTASNRHDEWSAMFYKSAREQAIQGCGSLKFDGEPAVPDGYKEAAMKEVEQAIKRGEMICAGVVQYVGVGKATGFSATIKITGNTDRFTETTVHREMTY